MGGKRKYHLDFLRILAAFLVMVHHSELAELYHTGVAGLGGSFVLCCVTCFVVINVPLFFLISGALLLGKEEPDRVVYTKRFPRFLLLTFLASSFAYIFRCFSDFNVKNFFWGFFAGDMDVTHWYLYAYLGFLVCVPFLRRAVRGMTHTDAVVLVCLRFLFGSLLPAAGYITGYKGYENLPFSDSFSVPFATLDILFYPIMGYYLEEKLPWDKADWKWPVLSLIVMAGGIAASALVTCHEGLRTAFSGSYLRLFVYSTAMAAFVLAKYLFTRPHREGKFRQVLEAAMRTASSLMLGVYILEPVLRPVVKPLLIGWMGEGAGSILTSLWYCVFGMAVYGGITWLLKKIPGLGKIL
ncbi:MAG: acyltransferase [Eubacteriales bacterium]|nr:acyltransferase [Eubacteriales bacterium]